MPSPVQPHSPARTQALTVALNALTSVLSETEGPRPPPTAFSGHAGRHNVATETCGRHPQSLHNRQILSPEPSTSRHCLRQFSAGSDFSPVAQLAHAACPTTFPASKPDPAFHTAKVIAAILRAIVTRASSGRSPFASSPAYHDLNGSHREEACGALLKTCLSVRL